MVEGREVWDVAFDYGSQTMFQVARFGHGAYMTDTVTMAIPATATLAWTPVDRKPRKVVVSVRDRAPPSMKGSGFLFQVDDARLAVYVVDEASGARREIYSVEAE